jgi:DNA-binding transcriptional regulator YhcF (GntR family)
VAHYTPAVSKAVLYLEALIAQNTLKAGENLPSIRVLAEYAHVSQVSMWKAVNELAKEGKLEVIHGQGTRIPAQYNHVITPRAEMWVKVREQIHREILSGKFSGYLMPSLKEMRIRYGVSHTTLKKALESLSEDGIIRSCRRTYQPVSYVMHRSVSSIVLLGWSSPHTQLQARTPWGEEFLRSCETLCSIMKINFRVLTYSTINNQLVFADSNGNKKEILKNDDTVIGYLLWAESPDELYRDVLMQIKAFNKPVAVLQEGSVLKLSEMVENRKMQVFSLATSSRAAKQVASYLLELGHKSIAFFSPFNRLEWSKARLAGLKEIYSCDSEIRVKPYVLDNFEWNSFRWMTKTSIFENLFKELSTVGKIPEGAFRILNGIGPALSISLTEETVRVFMQPIFKKALTEEKECTAWVCANDPIALMALDFLKSQKTNISVIGFDDTFGAFRAGLTSYNFNVNALVNSMLSYLVNPSSHSVIRNAKIFEVEGMLVERSSTFRKH